MACLNASAWWYRFLVLFFNCMLTFGSYFCFDMPGVLQGAFTGVNNCTNGSGYTYTEMDNVTCNNCTDCLGMSVAYYNLLYATGAWTSAFVLIGAGFLIDKYGNMVGVFLFSSLSVLGSSAFAAGVFFKGTSCLLPIMLTGRLLSGVGNGSILIIQFKITSYWFKYKELAMAMGISLCLCRLGSVLNFLVTESFMEAHGLLWTMWGGAFLCVLGFISGVVVSALDTYGVRQAEDHGAMKAEAKKIKITDIKQLPLSFWFLVLTIMFFYSDVFPFVADASRFVHIKYGVEYHLTRRTSAYIAGAVYAVPMLVSPFLGRFIDKIGKRGYLAMLTAALTIPVFGILAFTDVFPLVSTLWLGLLYCAAVASLFSSIPLVVSQAILGTARGLTGSIVQIWIGVSNLVVGEIIQFDKGNPHDVVLQGWQYVMVFLLANGVCCLVCTIFLNIVDHKTGGNLNKKTQPKSSDSGEDRPTINGSVSDGGEDPLLPRTRYLDDSYSNEINQGILQPSWQ